MTILIFFIVLFVLILVHEFGHFIFAKKTGMRVDEFGIGFPPKLFGIKKGETEYTFNLLPIGGFVKIYGEDAIAVEEAGGVDADRAFANRSKIAQAATLIAGVLFNALFAWLLFSIVFATGTQTAVSEEDATSEATLSVLSVLDGSPADSAGVLVGDVITGVSSGGEVVVNLVPSETSSFISENDEVILSVLRGSEELTLTVIPESGLVPEDSERSVIGVSLGLIEMQRMPLHIAVYEGALLTVKTLGAIVVGISALLVDAVLLDADFSQVAGPVGIVGLVGDAASFGFSALLMFTAFISLNLAVINLLPFPALDGGRLLFVVIETIKGSPINPKFAYYLNLAGFALLMLLMIAVTYNDILRIVS